MLHLHVKLHSVLPRPDQNFEVTNYLTSNLQINTVVINVRGRYPAQGWVSNMVSTMSCLILRGRGRIHIKKGTEIIFHEFNNTDVIELLPGDIYFWEPITESFQMCVSSAPSWTSEQQQQIPD